MILWTLQHTFRDEKQKSQSSIVLVNLQDLFQFWLFFFVSLPTEKQVWKRMIALFFFPRWELHIAIFFFLMSFNLCRHINTAINWYDLLASLKKINHIYLENEKTAKHGLFYNRIIEKHSCAFQQSCSFQIFFKGTQPDFKIHYKFNRKANSTFECVVPFSPDFIPYAGSNFLFSEHATISLFQVDLVGQLMRQEF